MTLVVSLRVPDGIVLAADSLQTTQSEIKAGIKDVKVKHPETGKEIALGDVQLPPINISTSTSSYAQKIFPFSKKFGVAAFGNSIINKRTIYNHFKNLESNLENEIKTLSDAAEIIKKYFEKEAEEEIKSNTKYQKIPNDAYIFGFQVAGYESKDDILGKTIELLFGKTSRSNNIDGIGCSVSGDLKVVQKLFKVEKNEPVANFEAFSLQDAIDYSEFLINTTSSYQRFSNMIPTVGGAVDIALITNYSKFIWIKYKSLTKILESI